MSDKRLKALQKRLGYSFNDTNLLVTALTHSSYANENKNIGMFSNERLEFLGDSVLGLTVAALIYETYPNMPEGDMTKLRAEFVCEKSLAAVAMSLDLGEYLMLGRGEDKNGGRGRPSILADAFEATLAAMYLDGGFLPIAQLIEKHFDFQKMPIRVKNSDYKTMLQEVVQVKSGQQLVYNVTDESGPDHLKFFDVEVRLNDNPIGQGRGRSKKEAEQNAAKAALAHLKRSDVDCI